MATVGDKPEFDFKPKTHAEIGAAKGWIDKERAAKVAGSRFVYKKAIWRGLIRTDAIRHRQTDGRGFHQRRD